jgi:hypothetical protein
MFTGYFDTWFMQNSNHTAARRAWVKMRGMAMILAIAEHGYDVMTHREAREKCLSAAWEDIAIAFRGRGDSWTTGAVLLLFQGMAPPTRQSFARGLEKTLKAIEQHCDEHMIHSNYTAEERQCVVLTEHSQFTLPCAVAAKGGTNRDIAFQGGVFPSLEVVLEYAIEHEEFKSPEALAKDPKDATSTTTRAEAAQPAKQLDRAKKSPSAKVFHGRTKNHLRLVVGDENT